MSAPSVLERCRMALAEIGLDPNLAKAGTGVPGDRVRLSAAVPDEVAWLLINTAGQALCRPCYRLKRVVESRTQDPTAVAAVLRACGAWRPFQRESCGAQP